MNELRYRTDGWFMSDVFDISQGVVNWFYYELPDDAMVEITYADNLTFYSSIGNLYFDTGIGFDTSSEQSYISKWNIGAHQFNISFMGTQYPVNVNVVATNVASITLSEPMVTIYENSMGDERQYSYSDDNTQQQINSSYFHYRPEEALSDVGVTVTVSEFMYYDFNGDGVIDSNDYRELQAIINDNYNLITV